MIVLNIGGGPGSGKTTLAYYLTYRLKVAGYRAEFVGEAAREEHIYDSTPGVVPPPLLDNQILLAGQQYERLVRLKRHGFQVAVNDSPILQGVLYCSNERHREYLKPLIQTLHWEFKNLNVWAQRTAGKYDPESRLQKTEAEAAAFDKQIHRLMMWDFNAYWGLEAAVGDEVILRLRQYNDISPL